MDYESIIQGESGKYIPLDH